MLFYFDLIDGAVELDTIGTDLPTAEHAEREAVRFAGEVLKSEPDWLRHGKFRLRVRNQDKTIEISLEIELRRSSS